MQQAVASPRRSLAHNELYLGRKDELRGKGDAYAPIPGNGERQDDEHTEKCRLGTAARSPGGARLGQGLATKVLEYFFV